MQNPRSPRGRRGVALFLSIGAISLLAVLASVFATSSRIERSVSRNYADMVRARLLAQSGVERAVVQVRRSVAGDDVPDALFSSADDLVRPWTYGRPASGPPTPRPAFYEPRVPLDQAIFCSFSTDPLTGRSLTVRLAGRTNFKVGDPVENGYGNDEFAVSGQLAGTYTPQGDFYSVKVIDGAAKIYMNGPDRNDDDPDPAVAGTVAPLASNVIQLLDGIASVLNQEQGFSFTDLARRVDSARTALGRNLVSVEELSLGSRDLELLRPYVTAHMWMDPSTLQPQALEHPRANDPNLVYNPGWRGGQTSSTGAPGGRRSAERVLPDGPTVHASCCSDRLVSDDPGSRVPGGSIHWDSAENDQETPSPAAPVGPVRQPRAPVNLNTAARETIQAVLAGLRGQYLARVVSTTEPRTYMGDGYATGSGEVIVTAGPNGIAKRVALALVQRRSELVSARGYGFAAWYDFHSFMDAIDDAGSLAALDPTSRVAPTPLDSDPIRAQAIKDTIKANADPNSRIDKFNPDRTLGGRFGDTDKADLTRWTTEFGFHSCGYFEVEAIGRVCAPPNASGAMPVVAEKRVVTAVRLYDVYRMSTQREFVANMATGTGGSSPAASYPEHLADLAGPGPAGWAAAAAEFDGWLALPTSDAGPAPGTQLFRATYTDGFGPDAAGPAEHATSVVNCGTGGAPSVGGQSELLVDGLFSHETRRYPDYGYESRYGAAFFGRSVDDYVRNGRASDKIRMREGTVEMWVKPTWGAEEFPTMAMPEQENPRAEGRRAFFTMGEGKLGTAYGTYQGPRDQSVCDNRIYLYAGHEDGGTYLMATQGTRICEPWGWAGVIPAGPHPATDFYPLTGMYHTNWYRLPSTPEPRNAAAWDPRNWRYAGQWHHLRFCWRNDRSWLYADGNPAGDDPLTSGRAEAMTVESAWSLFVGHNRFRKNSSNGYPCNADATLDDVRVEPTPISTGGSFLPPHRYASRGVYEGRIGPRQGGNGSVTTAFGSSARVLSLSWTVRMPRFTGMQPSCDLSLKVGGGAYESIAPDMSGNPPVELAGRGTRVRTVLPRPGEECLVRIDLRSAGVWRVGTPLLDDVTVVAATGGPVFLYRFDE